MKPKKMHQITSYCPNCGKIKGKIYLKSGRGEDFPDIACKCKNQKKIDRLAKHIEISIEKILYIRDCIEGIPGKMRKSVIRCPKCKYPSYKYSPAISIRNLPCANRECDLLGMDIVTSGVICTVTASGVIS
jgi:hypothetical protein